MGMFSPRKGIVQFQMKPQKPRKLVKQVTIKKIENWEQKFNKRIKTEIRLQK
jgi:hypothetical protein